MSPILHPVADTFLLGFIAACSLVAGVFFLRFWKDTRDYLFIAFAFFFLAQACGDAWVLTLSHPNVGSVGLFLLHLLSVLAVLGGILGKNAGKG